MLKNPVNCWEALRADVATTWLVTAGVMAQKDIGLGNQQPSRQSIIGGRFNDQGIARSYQAIAKRRTLQDGVKIWSDLHGNMQQPRQARVDMVLTPQGGDTMQLNLELVERFHEKWEHNKHTGCWEWKASTAGKGYGQIKNPKTRENYYAHRLSYLIHCGPIPQDKMVCHACDNPRCVKPSHLFIADAKGNLNDMKDKGRHLFGEKNAKSKLTDDKVRRIHKLAAEGLAQAKIAAIFGVSQSTVWKILNGVRWNHIYREIAGGQEVATPAEHN